MDTVNFIQSFSNLIPTMSQLADWFLFSPTKPLLFNSSLFLGLFIFFYALYIMTQKAHKFRVVYVVAFSLFFYYKSSGIYFILLGVSSIIDFTLAKMINNENRPKVRKFYLITSLVSNLGMLAYFKYTNFLLETSNSLFQTNFSLADIILPVGISFYTFQTLSYTIDVYRKQLAPTKSFIDFLFFVSFFPQLVAGPIVRASDFIPQMYQTLKLSKENLHTAFFLIIGGLFKKAVISDYISTNFVDRVFDAPNSYTAIENLLATYGYSIQIYCDFSGYSDIAIGIALLMGFWLPENFRTPYRSGSVTEFWKRWHISLSSWLRDYLYISLGGNRKGKIRTYVNLFLTMVLGGLWHGASWKFVVWGMLHGSALAVERFFGQFISIPKNKGTKVIQVILTFHFVSFCWIFFRARNFDTAFDVIRNITHVRFDLQQWSTILSSYQMVMALIAIGFVVHFAPSNLFEKVKLHYNATPLTVKAVILGSMFWIVYITASAETQPFIYFQF